MHRHRIYLVDDDDSVLAAVSRLLTIEGFKVMGFQSASDFLRHHDIDTPGCAVLDVGLGECDGLEVQREAVLTPDTGAVVSSLTTAIDLSASINGGNVRAGTAANAIQKAITNQGNRMTKLPSLSNRPPGRAASESLMIRCIRAGPASATDGDTRRPYATNGRLCPRES